MQDKSCLSGTTDDDCLCAYLRVSAIRSCITSSGRRCCLRSIGMCQIARCCTADRRKPELHVFAFYSRKAVCCWWNQLANSSNTFSIKAHYIMKPNIAIINTLWACRFYSIFNSRTTSSSPRVSHPACNRCYETLLSLSQSVCVCTGGQAQLGLCEQASGLLQTLLALSLSMYAREQAILCSCEQASGLLQRLLIPCLSPCARRQAYHL